MTESRQDANDDLLQVHQKAKLSKLLDKETRSWSKYERAESELGKDRVYRYEEAHGRETRPTRWWWYVIGLLGIGAVEYLLNFESFRALFGVPALALGFTITVAIMVAIASHFHGTLLKQPIRRQELRSSDDLSNQGYRWWLLGVSFGLLGALGFVVAVRYLSWSELDDLGVELSVWPKVLTTLLSNVLVWIIGSAFAFWAHSEGQYTQRQGERDRAEREYTSANQSVNSYQGELQAGRPPEQEGEVKGYVERERASRRQAASALALVLFVLAVTSLCVQPARAQFSSEYDIDQFCGVAKVAAAEPARRTVIYLDESAAVPADFRADDAKGAEGRSRALAKALASSEWFAQLRSKLSASLMASEHVAVVLVRYDGSVEDVADLCWPGYSERQREDIASRGFLESFLRADPRDDLPTQRDVAFARVRTALAESMAASVSRNGGSYVRALSRDEGRLRSADDRFVRVIFFGSMAEESEYRSAMEGKAPAESARRAVERTSLRLGGASFYIYGVRDASDGLEAFWRQLIRSGGGQLAAWGAELALVAKVPRAHHQFSLEVEVAPPEHIRRGRATVLVAEGGEVVDGAVVLAGAFRATLSGSLSCGGGGDVCTSSCDLRVETRQSVYFKSLPRETMELAGTSGSLEGYIGESDYGQPSRAYARVLAKVEGCG